MTPRLLFLMVLFVGLTASTCQTPKAGADTPSASTTTDAPPPGPPFLALRQYNPASDAAHAQFLRYVAALNDAVAATGLAPTQYLVWKVMGRRAGGFDYVLGSLWPDRATYDAVEDHAALKAVVARFEQSGVEPFKEERAGQFILLNPPTEKRGPIPWDRITHLKMEAHVLESTEQEKPFIAILEEGSAAIARAGHPETRYDLWRSADAQNGAHAYLFGSLWADRAAYDAVHENPAHQAFMKRHQSAFEVFLKNGVANRYERVVVK